MEQHKPAVMIALKESTMDLHKEIEQHMPVFRANFDKSKYQELLKKMHRFYKTFESSIKHSLENQGQGEFYKERYKTPQIEADLKSLNTEPANSSLPEIPLMNSLAAVAGALYVIEGSSLGGQIICKHLKENLALAPEQIHFFQGYGPLTGKRWQEFQKWVGTLDFNDEETKVAVASARDTFKSMMTCLKN